MEATMQMGDLLISDLLEYGGTVRGDSVIEYVRPDGTGIENSTFAEIRTQSHRLAHVLSGLGVARGDVVGTLCWNTAEHLTAYLAVPAMGVVLHTINLRLHPDDVAYVANQAGDRVIIVDADQFDAVRACVRDLTTVSDIVVVGDISEISPLDADVRVHSYDDLLGGAPDSDFAWPSLSESEPASICYTSGTTGHPKGIVYSHRSLFLHALMISSGAVYAMSDSDRVLPIVPMFHVNAWGLPYAAWMTGADLVMPGRHLKSPALADLITETRPTIAVAVPTVWTGLAEHARADPRVDFRSLRLAISGGSAMPLRLVREMGQLGVIMTQGWGMTETSPLVAYTKTPAGTDPSDVQQWTIQAGQIIPGVKIRLTDDSGHVLPWDGITVGELEMRGPTIAAAYHGLAASDEKFRDGWLRSGDLGSISPRGWVRIHDRLKDGIKSGGEWISTPDLESAILEHPAIRESMVFGIPDPKWQERPLACVVLQPGHSDLPEDIEDFLASRVAKFWIPQQWAVVSSVPKTTVGKLDKKSMRKRFEEGGFEVITAHGPPTASI